MNRLYLILFSIMICGLLSCGSDSNVKQMKQAIEKTDRCDLDSVNKYEVYIPSRNISIKKLPLLVIIDAHGNGKFALDKFKHGANQYPAILVASNLVKNGFANFEAAIQILIEDVRQKYPINETVFLTGFSGGARMALVYATTHKISGLISCSALANIDQVHAIHCPIISISGMDDFNFIETAQYLFQERLIPQNLKIELTNASHNWSDSLTLTNAFGFLYFSSLAANISLSQNSQLAMYCQNQHAKIDTLKEQGDFLNAVLVARNMSSTAPFNSDKTFAYDYNALKSNAGYIKQLKRLKECLKYEISMGQPYINSFTTKDSLWWKNEISTLNNKIKTEQDSFKNDMYCRIKGFLGIACYSLGNQAVKAKNAETMNRIVSIYSMLEPENPYVLYFSAFPYYWNGNNQTAITTLKKAQQVGFSDLSRLKQEFPESIYSKLP